MVCSVNIRKAFYENKQVLEDIEFKINKGEIIAIVGESGAGKTTLARIISGLWKFYPLRFEGNVDVDGIIDLIPQNITDSLDPIFKIKDQMREITKDEEKIRYTMDKVGFKNAEKILDSYPHNLSGGMKQRVLIAMSLLKSDIILADEFTSALDTMTKLKVIKLLKELNEKDNITFIFITHDMDLLDFGGKIIVLFDGKILEMGDSREIKKNPMHPYTKFLLSSSPKIGMSYKKERFKEIETQQGTGCPFIASCKMASEMCKTKKPKLKRSGERWIRCHF